MLGEFRAAAVNLSNAADKPVDVNLHFEGLPGSPVPAYVTVYEVPRTDTFRGAPVAAALPDAPRDARGWKIRVLPGLLRQVWFTFHVTGLPPGEHAGRLVLSPEEAPSLRVPVHLHVDLLRFPQQTELMVGGWDYTNGRGAYGITPRNRSQFVKHLRERFVNAPWVAAAESLLKNAAAEVLDARGATRLNLIDPKDRGIADAVRAKVLQALVALQQAD